MKNFALALLMSACTFFHSFGRANYYYDVNKSGKISRIDDHWEDPFFEGFDLKGNVQQLKKLELKLKKEKKYMLLSDYSVGLMKLGKQDVAVEILKRLYAAYPNEYRIAANLGTAYELNGQNDSALKYIKRDMELNPDDHKGSEWVHIKVLETKLQLSGNPAYLGNYTVLQLTDKQKNDDVVFYQILIQLKERVPFTPHKDQIMASLFTDLGDIAANIKSVEYAKAYYQIAKNYYGDTSISIREKILAVEKIIKKYASVKPAQPGGPDEKSKNIKLAGVRYQKLLYNNNENNYIIDWTHINTNVESLLAMVDFTKKPIRNTASNLH